MYYYDDQLLFLSHGSGSNEIILIIISVQILTAIPSDTKGPWVTLNSILFKFDFEDILG